MGLPGLLLLQSEPEPHTQVLPGGAVGGEGMLPAGALSEARFLGGLLP